MTNKAPSQDRLRGGLFSGRGGFFWQVLRYDATPNFPTTAPVARSASHPLLSLNHNLGTQASRQEDAMPTYEGKVARITSSLQQAVQARIHNTPLQITAVAHGSVRARFHTPLGDFGKTAAIDGGAFKVTVADVGELRYRLLVRADTGQTFFGVPIPIPVFRSLDLPAGSSPNLQVAFRILTPQDLAWLKSEFGVTVPATISYELFRTAVGEEPNLQNVRAKEEGGRLRIDFEYVMTGRIPKGRSCSRLHPAPAMLSNGSSISR